jgi:hypothetical protein
MYCDNKYKHLQTYIAQSLLKSGIISRVVLKDENDLKQTSFYGDHKEILSAAQGAGYCLWKPYYILETLSTLKNDETLFYLDSTDWIFYPTKFKTLVDEIMLNQDFLFFEGGFLQKEYTRYDCFHLMNCLNTEYTDKIQLEAGVLLLKNTKFTRMLVQEWLNYCKDPQIIMNIANKHGSNFSEYKDHRYDQSVLTNLVQKYKLPVIPMTNQLRNTFKCNYLSI